MAKSVQFRIVIALFFLTLTTACGFIDVPGNINDISKNTGEMSNDTTKLSNQTADMFRESQKLAQLTAMLLKANRQGVTQEQRVRAIQDVGRKDNTLELATRNAAVYFRGFEFQLWENTWYDTPSGREALFATAAEEFMITFRGIAGIRRPLEPLKMDADSIAIFALAGTLEQVNDLQVESAFKNNFQIVSILDLIFSALDQKSFLEENPNLGPKYAEKILQYEDEAKYLLQQRYAIFLAVMADKLLGLNQYSSLQKVDAMIDSWFKTPLSVDLAQLNAIELKELTYKYAYGALYVRNRMSAHGGVTIPPLLRRTLERAVFKDDPSAASGKRSLSLALKQAIKQILCETPACKIISDNEIESVVTDIKYRAEAPFSPEYAKQADNWMKLQIQRRVNDALDSELLKEGKSDYTELLEIKK